MKIVILKRTENNLLLIRFKVINGHLKTHEIGSICESNSTQHKSIIMRPKL
jgi:hypothetical protein